MLDGARANFDYSFVGNIGDVGDTEVVTSRVDLPESFARGGGLLPTLTANRMETRRHSTTTASKAY